MPQGLNLFSGIVFASGPHVKSSEEDAGRKVNQAALQRYFRRNMIGILRLDTHSSVIHSEQEDIHGLDNKAFHHFL